MKRGVKRVVEERKEERERERERELNDYQNLCNNPVEKTNQDLEVLNHHS